jgi:hypothetical protein
MPIFPFEPFLPFFETIGHKREANRVSAYTPAAIIAVFFFAVNFLLKKSNLSGF